MLGNGKEGCENFNLNWDGETMNWEFSVGYNVLYFASLADNHSFLTPWAGDTSSLACNHKPSIILLGVSSTDSSLANNHTFLTPLAMALPHWPGSINLQSPCSEYHFWQLMRTHWTVALPHWLGSIILLLTLRVSFSGVDEDLFW